MKTISTTLHHYRFDISNPDQAEQYNDLCARLKAQGLKVFDSIADVRNRFYEDHIAPLNGQKIDLETKHLFNNQWNTAPTATSKTGLRVFDWAEDIYPNKRLKQGHYLEQTDEMKEVREHTYKCGYCAAQYYKPKQEFCDNCTGSEYLTEKDYPLLFLAPVAQARVNYDAVIVPDSLVATIQADQKKARTSKLKKDQARKLKDLQQKIVEAQTELEAFTWLIDRNMDYENVIYYSHTKTFAFGWRNPINDSEKAKLKKILKDFPWEWEFSKK